MFRTIRTNQKAIEDNIMLMKNSREPLATIPNEYVHNISFSFQDVNEMNITISKKDNPSLYDKFIGKRQQIILNNEERFVVEECVENIEDSGLATKEITAYSFDYTLDHKGEFFIEEGSYCLYNDNKKNTDKIGILNMFMQDNPHWTIGHISENAIKEFTKKLETKSQLVVNNIYNQKVAKDIILWEKNFEGVSPSTDTDIMTIKIEYSNLEIYNPVLDMLQRTEPKIIHEDFINIPSPITNIKAEYVTSEDYKNAIKYTIDLSDGNQIIDYKKFVNIENYKIKIKQVDLIYTTGKELEIFDHKMRSFDEDNVQWRKFLKDNIQTAYDVIFEFNNMSKILNCYATEEVGEHIGIKLSYDNFIKSLNKTNEYGQVITKLIVNSEKTSLHEANPLCTDYILDFSYFIDNKLMSRECEVAWYRYMKFIEDNQQQLNNRKSELSALNKKAVLLESKKRAYELEIKNLEVLRNTYMKLDDTINVNRMAEEIIQKQQRLVEINKEYEDIQKQITAQSLEIKQIIEKNQFNNAEDKNGKIFNDIILEELEDLIIVETIEDNYYENSKELYDNYKYLLHEKNKLEINFDTTLKNLLKGYIPPKCGEWRDKFKVGNFVDIEDKDINIAGDGKIRIIKYEYSPRDKKVDTIYFSNKDKKIDDLVRLLEVGMDIKKSKKYTKQYKTTWKESRNINKEVSKIINEGIDVQKQKINGVAGRSLLRIEDASMYVIDSEDENKQMYFGASMVASTTDNWKTYTKTLDETGVNSKGQGEYIIGEDFFINSTHKDLSLKELKNNEGVGFTLQDLNDGKIRVLLGTEKDKTGRKARFFITNKAGEEILNEKGIISTNTLTTSGVIGRNCPFKTIFTTSQEEIRKSILTIRLCKLTSSVNVTSTGGGINSSFNVSDNKVNLVVPKHTHELDYTPRTIEGLPKNVSIKINGQTIKQGINEDISIDISSYVYSSGINDIEVSSDTTGSVIVNVYNKTFVMY